MHRQFLNIFLREYNNSDDNDPLQDDSMQRQFKSNTHHHFTTSNDNTEFDVSQNNNNDDNTGTTPGCSASTAVPARRSLRSGFNNNNNNTLVGLNSAVSLGARQMPGNMTESNMSIPSQDAARRITVNILKQADSNNTNDVFDNTRDDSMRSCQKGTKRKTGDDDDDEDGNDEVQVKSTGNINNNNGSNNISEASVMLIPRMKHYNNSSSNAVNSRNIVNIHQGEKLTTATTTTTKTNVTRKNYSSIFQSGNGNTTSTTNHNDQSSIPNLPLDENSAGLLVRVFGGRNNNNNNNNDGSTKNTNNRESFRSLDSRTQPPPLKPSSSTPGMKMIPSGGDEGGSSIQQQQEQQRLQHQQACPTTGATTKRISSDGGLPPLRSSLPPPVAFSSQNNNNNNNVNDDDDHDDNNATAAETSVTLPLPTIEKSFFHAAFVASVQPVAGSLLEENSTRVIRKVLSKLERVNTRPLFTGSVEQAALEPNAHAKNNEKSNANNDQPHENNNNSPQQSKVLYYKNNNCHDNDFPGKNDKENSVQQVFESLVLQTKAIRSTQASLGSVEGNSVEGKKSTRSKTHNNNNNNNNNNNGDDDGCWNAESNSRQQRKRIKCGVTDFAMNQIFFGKDVKTGKLMEKQADLLFVTTTAVASESRVPDSFSRNIGVNKHNNNVEVVEHQNQPQQHEEQQQQQQQPSLTQELVAIEPPRFRTDEIHSKNKDEKITEQQQRTRRLSVQFSLRHNGLNNNNNNNHNNNNDDDDCRNSSPTLSFPSSTSPPPPMRIRSSNLNITEQSHEYYLPSTKATMMKIRLNLEKPLRAENYSVENRETSAASGNEEFNSKNLIATATIAGGDKNTPTRDSKSNNFASSIPRFFRKFCVRCTLLNPLVHGKSNSMRTSAVTSRTDNENNSNNSNNSRQPQSQCRRKTRVSPTIVQVLNHNSSSRRKSPSKNSNKTCRQQQQQPIHKIYLPPPPSASSSPQTHQVRHQQITGILSLPGMPLKVMTTTSDFVFRRRFKSVQQVRQFLHQNENNNDHHPHLHHAFWNQSPVASVKSLLFPRDATNNDNSNALGKTVVDILDSVVAGKNGTDDGPRGKTSGASALGSELSSVGVLPSTSSDDGGALIVTRSTARNNNKSTSNISPVTCSSEKRSHLFGDVQIILQNTSSDQRSTQMQHLFSHTNDNNNSSKKYNESTNTNIIYKPGNPVLTSHETSNNKKSVGFVNAAPSDQSNNNMIVEDNFVLDVADSSHRLFPSSYIICDEEDDEILQLKKPSNATVLDVHDANLREAVEVGSASYLTAFLESSPSAFDGAASSLGRYCGTFQPVVLLGKGSFGAAYLVVYKENEKLLHDHQKNSAAPEPAHTVEEFIANNNNNNNGCAAENHQYLHQTPTQNNNIPGGFSLNNFSLVVSGAGENNNNNNTYYANDTSTVHSNIIVGPDFAALVRCQSRPDGQHSVFPSFVESISAHASHPRVPSNFQGCGTLDILDNNVVGNSKHQHCNDDKINDDDSLIPRVSKRQFGFYNPAGAVAVKEIFTLSKSHNPGTNHNDINWTANIFSTPSLASSRPWLTPPSLSVWNNNNNNHNDDHIQDNNNNNNHHHNNNNNMPSIFLSPAEQTSVVPRALRKKLLLPITGPAGGVSGMAATTPIVALTIKDKKTGQLNRTTVKREDLFVCKVEQLPDPELEKAQEKLLAKQQRPPWDSDFDDEEENGDNLPNPFGFDVSYKTTTRSSNNSKNPAQDAAGSSSQQPSSKRLLMFGAADTEKKKLLAMEANKQRLERMQNEAHILSNIAHPNIVGYIDYYLEKKTNKQLLFLEYVDGGDLQKEIDRRASQQPRRYFSVDSVLHIFVQIVLAVEYLHRHNILHRDIKSQNILISKHYFAKLTDFGASKQFDQDVDGNVACKLVGTPLYISPELVAKKSYSQKSDIWALGVLLTELLSFDMPFNETTFPELFQHIQFRPPCPLRRPGPPLPQEVLALVGRMLHKDPDMRPTAKNILTDFACMRGAAIHYEDRVSQFVKSSLSTPVDAAWLTVLRDHIKLIYGQDATVSSQQSRARDSMLRGSIARERSHQNMSSVVPMRVSVVNLASSKQGVNAAESSAAFDAVKSYHYHQVVSPLRRLPGVRAGGIGSACVVGAVNASGKYPFHDHDSLRVAGEASF